MPIDLRAFFVLFDFVKLRLQHFHRELAIASLAALGLASDDDTGWLVQDAHSSFHFVHVLPTLAAATKRVDLQIGGIDFDRRRIRDFRHHIDAGERGVPAFVCIKRRDSHQPMHTTLGLKVAISVLAGRQ